MEDTFVYVICFVLFVIGLFFGYLYFLDYDNTSYAISEDNDDVEINGSVLQSFYNEETNFTYLQVLSCEEVDSFYEGKTRKSIGDNIIISGSVFEGKINVKQIR